MTCAERVVASKGGGDHKGAVLVGGVGGATGRTGASGEVFMLARSPAPKNPGPSFVLAGEALVLGDTGEAKGHLEQVARRAHGDRRAGDMYCLLSGE